LDFAPHKETVEMRNFIAAILFLFIANCHAFPGEKLLDVSSYGRDEYLVVGLFVFILFVAVKHLVFHTLYFWWYSNGRFYVPDKYHSFINRNTRAERIFSHVMKTVSKNKNFKQSDDKEKLNEMLLAVEDYCHNVEFAPNFGPEKAKILESCVQEKMTKDVIKRVLLCGTSCGYVTMTMLFMLDHDDVTIDITDASRDNLMLVQLLLSNVEHKAKINLNLIAEPSEKFFSSVLQKGPAHYDVIVTTRSSHDQPSHVRMIECLQQNKMIVKGSLIFSDKIVHFSDPAFLLHVRESPMFETKYHQMALEHSSYDILDGIEVCKFVEKPDPELSQDHNQKF